MVTYLVSLEASISVAMKTDGVIKELFSSNHSYIHKIGSIKYIYLIEPIINV